MGARRTPEAVSLALAVFFVAVLNIPFWRLLYRVVEPRGAYDWAFIAALFVALLAVTYMVILLLAVRPLLRPVVGLLLPVTAAASYFMLEYGAVIDSSMVRNIFETDTREAGDLVSTKLLLYVAALGVLPALALWLVPIEWPSMAQDFRRKLKSALITLPLAAAVIFPFIIATGYKQDLRQPALVNALLLFSQSFMLGVFTAQNAFLFYIFYELSVVPIFFLLLYW